MNIVGLLQESFSKLKSNPVIAVPILAATLLIGILSLILVGSLIPQVSTIGSEVVVTAEEAVSVAGMAMWRLVVIMIIGSIAGLLAHGMTVLMADDALQARTVQLSTAWHRAKARIVPLLIASVVVGVLVSIGLVLLVLPGVVIAFFLMFTFAALMVHDLSPLNALGRSFKTVKGHFAAAFVFFLVMIALGVLVGLVNFVIGMIPILGAIIVLLVSSVYATFLSIFVVAIYRGLSGSDGAKPEPEV